MNKSNHITWFVQRDVKHAISPLELSSCFPNTKMDTNLKLHYVCLFLPIDYMSHCLQDDPFHSINADIYDVIIQVKYGR